jgi:hypothetical protein
MILGNPLLQRNIAEHPVLNPLVASHTYKTNHSCTGPQLNAYFNKFLESRPTRKQ